MPRWVGSVIQWAAQQGSCAELLKLRFLEVGCACGGALALRVALLARNRLIADYHPAPPPNHQLDAAPALPYTDSHPRRRGGG